MLNRTSGVLHQHFALLTLGASARYLIMPPGGSVTLFDPGASAHVPGLLQRLSQHNLTPKQVSFLFLTHIHPDRIGAAQQLKKLNPALQIMGTGPAQDALAQNWKTFAAADRNLQSTPIKFDKVLVEGDSIPLGAGISVRVIPSPGHTKHSVAYFVEPHRFLIADEVLGYFRGKELPAPGCDDSCNDAIKTLQSYIDIDILGLCLPYIGVLTGELTQRHLQSVKQTMEDLLREVPKALAEGISKDEIISQITNGLFKIDKDDPVSADPYLAAGLKQSCKLICGQLFSTETSN